MPKTLKHVVRNIVRPSRVSPDAILSPSAEINSNVFVGRYVYIGKHTYVHSGSEILSAKIGNFCSIGSNVRIGMFEHPTGNLTTSSRLYLRVLNRPDFYNDIPRPALIGNDVWIASGATVRGGSPSVTVQL